MSSQSPFYFVGSLLLLAGLLALGLLPLGLLPRDPILHDGPMLNVHIEGVPRRHVVALPVVGNQLPDGVGRQQVESAGVCHHCLGQLGVELLKMGQVDLQADLEFSCKTALAWLMEKYSVNFIGQIHVTISLPAPCVRCW